MSEKQKSFAKWIVALLALLGLGGGADAAGYELPIEQLKQLGAGTSIALIAYLHFVWWPLVQRMDGKLDSALAKEPEVAEPAAASRAVTPALGVVRNKS